MDNKKIEKELLMLQHFSLLNNAMNSIGAGIDFNTETKATVYHDNVSVFLSNINKFLIGI